jgi:hypothetical protein
LTKVRHEFEITQNSFLQEKQTLRMRLEETALQCGLRMTQLQKFRHLLDEREQSLQREQETLDQARRGFQETQNRERLREQTALSSWEREREVDRAELRRQQDMLALHAENLEARRLRLDRLRSELEETHRKTLEMRLSVEEACAQFSQAAGPEAARLRIEEARRALSEHYRQAREALIQQRHELEQVQALFEQQRDAFRDERQTLTEWMAQRDEELRQREAKFREEREVFESREQAWWATRDVWQQEKQQAEAVIRDLLQQLETATLAPPPPDSREAFALRMTGKP